MLNIRIPEERHYPEHILIPFYDPQWSSIFHFKTEQEHGVYVECQQQWCWYYIVWENINNTAQSLKCLVETTISADKYDHFIFSIAQANELDISFEFLFDDGRSFSFHDHIHGIEPQEIHVKLNKSDAYGTINRIAARFSLPPSSKGTIALNWMAGKLKDEGSAYSILENLSPWILPETQRRPVKFMRSLLFSETDLEEVRRKKQMEGWSEHFLLLENEAEKFLQRIPEQDFGDHLPNGDVRYVRSDNLGKTPYHWEALVLAFVGLVNKDSRYINHALRYLMCMLHCPNWCDNLLQYSPDGTWTPRSFQEEMTATSVAILIDWLYFALTDQTVSLACRAIWDRGISPVRRDLMQYDYMHFMNQGIVFNRACILGGLLLEHFWPRMNHHVDYAYNQTIEISKRYIYKDGSGPEGIGYFCQMSTGLIWSVIAYCRARKKDWKIELKRLFHNVDNFVSALCYNQDEGIYYPIADCRVDRLCGDVVPILALLFPNSVFSRALGACLKAGTIYSLTGTLSKSGGMIGMVYGQENIHIAHYDEKKKYNLKHGGILSCRSNAEPCIHLCILGGKNDRSHAHADSGSFMMSIDGKKLFIDRGMVNYWKNETMILKKTSSHNCLTPVVDGNYITQISTKCSHVSSSIGIWKMCASYDLSKNFSGIFESYIRKFDFDLNKHIIISDIVKFITHGSVAFHLHTLCKPKISKTYIEYNIDSFCVNVHLPWAKSISVNIDNMSFNNEKIYHCIAISEDIIEKNMLTDIVIS